jgi:hypothetical protein
MKLKSDVSPLQIYTIDFSNVYGVNRMILYDERSSVVGVAMFNLDAVENAIKKFRESGK